MTAPAPPRPGPPYALGALRHRNFRLFIAGQLVSLTGTWMQSVAQGWLVLELTDSAFMVGLVSALGSLPVLVLTLYGGVVADRVDRRRFILLLQSLMLFEALALAVLTHGGWITVEAVMALALVFGTLSAFEIPARQAFVVEMVGKNDLMNAIALNSSVFNVTRVIGPVVAGLLISTAGLAVCFYANALSYLGVIAGLLAIRLPPWTRPAPVDALAAFREGMRYILGRRRPRTLVALTAALSVFGFSFIPMLPVYADRALGAGPAGYGALLSAVGIGASGGALALAGFGHRVRSRFRLIPAAGLAFGALLILAALAGSLVPALLLFALGGCAMIFTNVLTNGTLQTEAPDHLRGRVVSFYSFVVVGLAPIGSFQAGWVAERYGVQASIAWCGAVSLAAAAWVRWRGGGQ